MAAKHAKGIGEAACMIRNDEELTIVRAQLARIQRALESLRRDVFPQNKRNFEVMSEGYVDQIAALQQEIDAYTAAGSSTVDQPAGSALQPIPSPTPDPAKRH